MSYTKLIVIGNLGKDAVVNEVNGQKVINFSVAHTEKWKDGKGVQQERTLWIECAKWGDNTAVAQYMTRGKQVLVEGTPDIRMYDKNDGGKGVSLVCRVGMIQLLGGGAAGEKKDGATAPEAAASAEEKPASNVPF